MNIRRTDIPEGDGNYDMAIMHGNFHIRRTDIPEGDGNVLSGESSHISEEKLEEPISPKGTETSSIFFFTYR